MAANTKERFLQVAKTSINGILCLVDNMDESEVDLMHLRQEGESIMTRIRHLKLAVDNDFADVDDQELIDAIGLFCSLSGAYYHVHTFLPATLILLNSADMGELSGNYDLLFSYIPHLTCRELLTGLKIVGEDEARLILSIDESNFEELFASFTSSDCLKFKNALDSSERKTYISASVIFAVLSHHIENDSLGNLISSINRPLQGHEEYNDAFSEISPTHISIITTSNPSINDEDIYTSCVKQYDSMMGHISELDSFLKYQAESPKLGRAKKVRLKAIIESDRLVETERSFNATFNPAKIVPEEFFQLMRLFSTLALQYIRHDMDSPDTLDEYMESSVGSNLNEFLHENFTFTYNKEKRFMKGEFHYFQNLCQLITSVLKLNNRNGGQRQTYALIYLFFPVDAKQKSKVDTLVGKRLNTKFLKWRDEPTDSNEALNRLTKYFPSLKENITDGDPSKPSRSREQIRTWMKEKSNSAWLQSLIRDIWTEKAIVASGFEKLLVNHQNN